MAARMPFGCLIVSLAIVTGWVGPARGQYLYAGPGVIVQRQIRGPFVYGLPSGPGLQSPFQLPRTFVPAPGPYLQGPVMVPPGRTYLPSPRPPGNVTPYGIPVQPYSSQPYSGYRSVPYRGYQPRPNRPRFADPYAQPEWRHGQTTNVQPNKGHESATATQAPTETQGTTERPGSKPSNDVKSLEGTSGPPDGIAAEPNRPAKQ